MNKIDATLYLVRLKESVQQHAGFLVQDKSACTQLALSIKISTDKRVSVSTLYRIFVRKVKYHPFRHTLDILAQFVGFRNWDQFVDANSTPSMQRPLSKKIAAFNFDDVLLQASVEKDAFSVLESLFETISSSDAQKALSFKLFDVLGRVKNPLSFYKRFAGNDFIRKEFFENGFDPLFRLPMYAEGFEAYLNESRQGNGIDSVQGEIFASSVLFKYYFDLGLTESAITIGKTLYSNPAFRSMLFREVHAFPSIRFRCYELYYQRLLGRNQALIDSLADQLLEQLPVLIAGRNRTEREIVFHTISETFLAIDLRIDWSDKLVSIFSATFSRPQRRNGRQVVAYWLDSVQPNGLLQIFPK